MKPHEEQGITWAVVTAMVKGGTVPADPTAAVLTVLELVMAEDVEVDTRVGDRLLERASFTTAQRENVLEQIREIEEGGE